MLTLTLTVQILSIVFLSYAVVLLRRATILQKQNMEYQQARLNDYQQQRYGN